MKIIKSFLLILSILGWNILTNFNALCQDKGTCTVPYATLTVFSDFASADAAYLTQKQSWSPDATGTINTYARINSGPEGKVGFDLSHEVASSTNPLADPNCVDNSVREIRLFPVSAGACNWASGITYSVADGGNGVTWSNPEFYGLTPNTDYIVQVKTIIPTTTPDCAVSTQYLTYYQISSPAVACQDYDIQMYSDDGLNTSITKTTFACDDPKVFLGPSTFPVDADFNSGLPYNSVNITFSATSGDLNNLVVNRYNSANVLVEVLTNTSSGAFNNFFLRPTGSYYAIDKTNTASGVYDYVITDNITGATLASGTWTITGGAESAKSVLVIPSGTGSYSGPGVSNGFNPSDANDYTDDRGIGVFDPVLAGPGNHVITYTWDNGLSGTNHCSLTKTLNVTVSPCPAVPCQDYDIQMYSDDGLNTSITKTTFACNDPKVFLGPNTFPSSSDFNSGLPFNSVNISFSATSGTLNNLVVNRYNSANVLVEVLTNTSSGAVNNYFLRPSGGYYSLDKTNTASGVYDYVIKDNVTGATLASGTWTITGGAESAKSVLVIPSGTGSYSGPGVSNGYDPSDPNDYTDDRGLGTFDPVVAGPGSHVITYTWDNGLTGTNHCSLTKTMNVTVSPCACGTVGFYYNSTTPPNPSSCSDNTEYSLKADMIANSGEYIAPGFTIEDDGGNLSYTTIEIEEGAGTGFVDVMGQKILTYCVPTYQYRVRLSGFGPGTVKFTDHATGATIYSGAFSDGSIITLAPGTIKGSSTFSGPGVTNVKKGKATSYVGSGYGVFNPSIAGVGSHTITYSWDNGNGCTGTSTKTVIVSGPPTPVALADFSVCAGSPLTLTATGGTIYSWSLGATSIGSGSPCSPAPSASVTPGVYTYYVSNSLVAGGCSSAKDSVRVTVSSSTTPIFSTYGPYCLNAAASALPTTSINGVAGTWSPSSISTATAGTVPYTFTPTNACDVPITINVVTSLKPVLSIVSDSVNCFGESNGSLTMSVSDGVAPYTYLWSNGDVTRDLINVRAGTYLVTVTDANSCTTTASGDVFQPVVLFASINGTDILCKDEQTGFVTATVNSGTLPYTYLWSNGDVTSTIDSLIANNYSVTITDGNGCTFSVNHTIQTSLGPEAKAIVYFASDNSAEAHFINQSTDAVSSNWSFGDGNFNNVENPIHIYQEEGEYLAGLVVVDENGCIDSTTIKVLVNPDFQIWIPNAFTPDFNYHNAVFKPKARGCKTEGYSMLIFDRWGELIFESNDLEVGWNGLYKNEGKMGESIFVYKITIVDIKGLKHHYVGHVAKIGDNIKK